MIPASKEFADFPHWQTDGRKLTLFDPSKHCSIGLAFDSFSFSQDMSDVGQERAFAKQMLEKLPSKLEVTSFSRLGIRRWYLTSVAMSFEALVAILDLKLFAQAEQLREILPANVKDVMYVTVNAEAPYSARISIGPVHGFEIPPLIPIDQEHHLDPQKRAEQYIEIIKKYPKVSIYYEIDYFQAEEQISIDDGKKFIELADSRIREIVTNLTNYFLSAKVKD